MAKGYEIHPGHWNLPNSGASALLNEVTEARRVARRVTELLKQYNVPVEYFEDNVSKNQTDNVNYLIKQHNKDKDDIVVSIHFNSSAGIHNKGIGTEVLYYDQQELAAKVAKAISDASGLINRGAKQRKDLGVLARTYEPAILIEVCFVNSHVDKALYTRDFEKICFAIAKVLAEHLGYKVTTNQSAEGVKPMPEFKLNDTGRESCRNIIRHAAQTGLFQKDHLQKVDKYSDSELISYVMPFIERVLIPNEKK